MFISDVNKKDEIRTIAIKNLRKLNAKPRIKYSRPTIQASKEKQLFHVALSKLENETVTLRNGQQLVVPKRLYEMCSFILSKVETEGLFRKEGSKNRQNKIKASLNRGYMLGLEHHVIDVAVILKCFLRELPEPLIPCSFHELFLRCSIIEKKVEAILLACLLIPTEHLNVLAFLMQFFNEITLHSDSNRMDSYNLSLIIAPNIFTLTEKISPKNELVVKKTIDITQIMIDNANSIGLIPDSILEQVGNLRPGELALASPKVKRRRRSGSLTRIFNGFKKIVTNKSDDIPGVNTVTPDLLLTPSIRMTKNSSYENKSTKHKPEPERNKKALLQRRWSAITSATNLRRKKRESVLYQPREDSLNSSQEAYVRVPKVEYEEIKNRVSAIEKRLSFELETVASTVVRREANIIQDIQSEYEKTLGQAEALSPGTDQLARRLSKELKIRTSEQKIIRSPSARKIGNIRRRSRELVRNNSLQHVQHVSREVKETKLTRSISSPLTNKNFVNVTGTPSFNSTSHITFKSNGYSFNSENSLGKSASSGNISDDKNFSRHSSLRRERRILRRSSNVTPKRTLVKERYNQFSEVNKENNVKEMGGNTPVPHIKRTLPIKGTPKRFCATPKANVRSTPLRVLPNAEFNYVNI
ncbi:T-cell activation Rho GTPase-activating protein-like [Diabrotica virgifera virgifera]|uniref:Rho-GAP domain-containing protein n=1 Tax=Diabrotica virgifera virgifera TaxID=50390 RepID=A0ABM5KJU3_DIAVI|nr:T-cell activation Rho GTPase-activating protein-like [Diabrotica virgifera virgifera]